MGHGERSAAKPQPEKRSHEIARTRRSQESIFASERTQNPEDRTSCASSGCIFCVFRTALLKNRRASRGFSKVGQIAPQAPVGRRLSIHRRTIKRLLCILRAPRAAGIAEQLPLPFDPRTRCDFRTKESSRVLVPHAHSTSSRSQRYVSLTPAWTVRTNRPAREVTVALPLATSCATKHLGSKSEPFRKVVSRSAMPSLLPHEIIVSV
jgi:hypothetical protein